MKYHSPYKLLRYKGLLPEFELVAYEATYVEGEKRHHMYSGLTHRFMARIVEHGRDYHTMFDETLTKSIFSKVQWTMVWTKKFTWDERHVESILEHALKVGSAIFVMNDKERKTIAKHWPHCLNETQGNVNAELYNCIKIAYRKLIRQEKDEFETSDEKA